MSAPLLFIGVPLALAALLAILPLRPRLTAVLGGLAALILAGLPLVLPLNTAIRIGQFSFKIEAAFQVLGRQFILGPESQSLLTILYGLAGLWLLAAETARTARMFVPLGLTLTALLTAALSVQPFLYAALLIEMTVLAAIPMLAPLHRAPGRGVIRFLIYQTLALPFILFSGWLLAGVEASPGDLALARQSTILLGLGFAFLLAIFPLSTWIPQLSEEAHPYSLGFLLWIQPTVALLFGMGFLDRYTWLRTAEQLPNVLRLAGLLAVVTGGWLAAFQGHFGRILAYAAICETGYALLALSLGNTAGFQVVFLLIVPRAFGLAVWALALTVLGQTGSSLSFSALQGRMRDYPIASGALILAQLSLAGLPLLAGFPARLVLWEALAGLSLQQTIWFGLGLLGLFVGATRSLTALAMSPELTPWSSRESWPERILLGLGVAALFLFGLFPQLVQPLLTTFPLLFTHLGR